MVTVADLVRQVLIAVLDTSSLENKKGGKRRSMIINHAARGEQGRGARGDRSDVRSITTDICSRPLRTAQHTRGLTDTPALGRLPGPSGSR